MGHQEALEDLEQAQGTDAGVDGLVLGGDGRGRAGEGVPVQPGPGPQGVAGLLVALVLQQASGQRLAHGAGVLLVLGVGGVLDHQPGQQLPALEEAQRRGQHDEVPGQIEVEDLQELEVVQVGVGDGGNADIADVHALAAHQVQEQLERAVKGLGMDSLRARVVGEHGGISGGGGSGRPGRAAAEAGREVRGSGETSAVR